LIDVLGLDRARLHPMAPLSRSASALRCLMVTNHCCRSARRS